MVHGLTFHRSEGGWRVEAGCPHQGGVLYIVPAEGSWVCDPGLLPAHALAGFFRSLTQLNDPRVRELMWRYGLFFRSRPVEEGEARGAG